MGKSKVEESDLNGLAKKILEKKQLLTHNSVSNSENAINIKKLSREEKDKIRKAIKKKKRKMKKQENNHNDESSDDEDTNRIRDIIPKPDLDPSIEVEYVEKDEYLLTGKYYDEFKHVFQFFSAPKQSLMENEDEEGDIHEIDEDKNGETDQPLSRKKKKMLKRLKVAQLKAQVKRPDVVEVWDTTAKDALTLVYLKSYKNSVPVPRHWSQKRKFLQNKRGILKPPFKLPEHIEKTGIAKLRDPFNDKEAGRLVRQKLRERMNPKLGKIDIDYEVLHNAFFKFQERPKMSKHGDVYYEGKEDEVKMQSYRPWKISEHLRQALGISEFAPAPWVVNMQRYGPPPSYPHLKIPVKGLNAPLPDGSGYTSTRLLDELGRPILPGGLYGNDYEETVDKTLWGEPLEEDIEEQLGEPEMTEVEPKTNTEEKSGFASVISGMETPDIELQKKPTNASHSVQNINYNSKDSVPKPLYQVLEPVQKNIGSNIFGSSYGYIIPGTNDTMQQEEQPISKENPKEAPKESKFKF